MQVSTIIDLFGGVRPLARDLSKHLGEDVSPSTVQGWKDRANIPAKRQRQLMALAKDRRVALTPADFFDEAAA